MKSLIKKIISFTSTISLIWSLAACSVDATSEPSPKRTVATPVFSVESGEVTSGTTVEITCSTEGAAIYYTTNGSVPTAESTRYTTSITIEPPMTVKAIAIKKGMNNSAVAEVVYEELIIDYFEGLSDFYGRCDIFNESNYYQVEKKSDKKIYCTYYSDSEGKNELSKEILTYSVSGNIASLKGESGTEFAININTNEFVTKKIVFNGNVYDLMDVWYSVTSANLADYLSTLEDNTSDNPYKIKISDLSPNSIIKMIIDSKKFVSIKIDDSVTSIRDYAFTGFSRLTSIIIPNSVTSIGEYAFGCCERLTSVTIPNSVTSIRDGAFYSCPNLTSVTIPSSVNSIGERAFKESTNLTSVTIPNSVTSIELESFGGCTSLTSIIIPNSITSIGEYAFNYCTHLTSVIIPNSVTSIGDSAFCSCINLTTVTIPNSVTSIGDYVFLECTNLTVINYTGTEEQWNAISKSSEWNEGVPSDCVINYNYQE